MVVFRTSNKWTTTLTLSSFTDLMFEIWTAAELNCIIRSLVSTDVVCVDPAFVQWELFRSAVLRPHWRPLAKYVEFEFFCFFVRMVFSKVE